MESITENHGLARIPEDAKRIYSVGVSTAGQAEIRMARSSEANIIGTTIDEKGAQFAREAIAKEGLEDRIQVKLEDVSSDLPYKDDSFDYIYARLVLHYLDKQSCEQALSELHRILAPRRSMYLVVRSTREVEYKERDDFDPITELTTYPSRSPIYLGQPVQRRFFDEHSLRDDVEKAGFDIDHMAHMEEVLCADFERKHPNPFPAYLLEAVVRKDG